MKRSLTIHDLCLCALFTALLTICAWITIPAPIPFTLQSFGVFVTLLVLGGKRGTLSFTAYLLLGALGVPLFSGFRSGLGALFDTTGGYLVGFLLAAVLYHVLNPRTVRRKLAALIAGQGVVYLFGTVWFAVLYAARTGIEGLGTALIWCVVPFVIPDMVKLWLALFLANRLHKKGLPL